jgi:hypothetical protein
MQQDTFIRSMAAERYCLGEMSDAEREEYEAHFLGCSECTRELALILGFTQHARAIFASEEQSDSDC